MIVARGLGVGSYSALITTAGLGKLGAFFLSGGGSFSTQPPPRRWPAGTAAQDVRDLSEILPALFGVLNGNS